MLWRKASDIPWGWAVFVAAVFAACCCLHIGLSGKYSDDYAITMRDLATGQIDWSLHPWARFNYFWRPLHLALLWAVGTAFWEHDWVAHTLSAMAHGGCALALGVWLRRMGISARVSVVAALLFLSNTLQAEAINWFSTICVSIGGMTLVWVLEVARRGSASGAVFGVGKVMGMAALSFAAACWYESSAAGLLALPVVMVAARPSGERVSAAIRRAIVPTAACGAACVVYAALLLGTAPSWQRGSAARMAGPSDLVGRVMWLGRQWGEWLGGQRGRDLWVGAWIEGWAWMSSPAGVVLGAVVVVAGVTAIVSWVRSGSRASGQSGTGALPVPEEEIKESAQAGRLCHWDQGGAARLGWLAAAGLALFAGAWVPFALVKDNSVELRAWYAPLIGMAMVAACGLEVASRWLTRREGVVGRLLESAAGAALVCAVLAGALAQVGWQRVFVRVWQEDEKRAAAIVAALPNPEQDTVIMPLLTKARGASTGRKFFDLAVEGGLGQSWSSWAFVQRAYKRRDITATNLSAWAPEQRPLSGFGERGVWSTVHLKGDFEHSERGCFVPWAKALPVELGPDGALERVRGIRVLRPVEQDLVIGGEEARRLCAWYEQPPGVVQFRDPDANWGRRLTRWTEQAADGKKRRVEVLKPRSAWPLVELGGVGQRSRAIWTELPASTRSRVAVIRWCASASPSTGRVVDDLSVRAGWGGESDAVEEIRWAAESHEACGRLVVSIPAQERGVRLWIEVRAAKAGGASSARVVLDPAWLIDLPGEDSGHSRGVPASGAQRSEYTPPTAPEERANPEGETE